MLLTYSIQSQNCQVENIAPIEGRVMFLAKTLHTTIVVAGPCAPLCQIDKGTVA